MVRAEIGVIEIIKHAGLAVGVKLAQDQRARPGRQSKAGMQFTEAGKRRLAVCENNLELTRSDDGIVGKGPLSEVGIGNGQAEIAEGHWIGGWVVKLQPATALAGAVGNPGQIVGLQLIQPKWRGRRQAGGDRVGRGRAAGGWWGGSRP